MIFNKLPFSEPKKSGKEKRKIRKEKRTKDRKMNINQSPRMTPAIIG